MDEYRGGASAWSFIAPHDGGQQSEDETLRRVQRLEVATGGRHAIFSTMSGHDVMEQSHTGCRVPVFGRKEIALKIWLTIPGGGQSHFGIADRPTGEGWPIFPQQLRLEKGPHLRFPFPPLPSSHSIDVH